MELGLPCLATFMTLWVLESSAVGFQLVALNGAVRI